MDLSKITARVRPRNPYEAADLGIVMARQWFRPLMLLWLIPSLPLMLVLFFLFRDQPIWAVLILWWLKPLWETLQLQFIAEALFNPDAQWRDVLKQVRAVRPAVIATSGCRNCSYTAGACRDPSTCRWVNWNGCPARNGRGAS